MCTQPRAGTHYRAVVCFRVQSAASKVRGTVNVASPGVSGAVSYGGMAPAPAPAAWVASFAPPKARPQCQTLFALGKWNPRLMMSQVLLPAISMCSTSYGASACACVQVSVDATDPFSLMEMFEAPQPDFAAASDSILVATGNGAGGAVSEAIGFLLSNETRANATNDDVRCSPCH